MLRDNNNNNNSFTSTCQAFPRAWTTRSSTGRLQLKNQKILLEFQNQTIILEVDKSDRYILDFFFPLKSQELEIMAETSFLLKLKQL